MDKATKHLVKESLFELETEIGLSTAENKDYLLNIVNKVKSSISSLIFFSDDGAVVETRTDLVCPFCNKTVYDNRARKNDPNDSYYKTRKPDFSCSNIESPDEAPDSYCKGGKWNNDNSVYWSASWWLTTGNLPKEWNI